MGVLRVVGIVGLSFASIALGMACAPDSPVEADGGSLDATPSTDAAALDGSDVVDAPIDTGPVPVGDLAFVQKWPTTGYAEASAAFPDGGYVVVGRYNGSPSIGPSALPFHTKNSTAGFLATVDAKGAVTGAISLGIQPGVAGLVAVGVTKTAIFVGGYASVAFSFNGVSVPAGAFVAKLDRSNVASAPLWLRSMTNVGVLCPSCLAVSENGVFALATGSGAYSVDSQLGFTAHGSSDGVVVKMDAASGVVTWAKRFGGAGAVYADGIALGADGSVHLAANATSAIVANEAFGPVPPVFIGTDTMFVAKLDANGGYLRGRSFGDPQGGSASANCFGVSASGRVLVGGIYKGQIDFGKGAVSSAQYDAFVDVLSPDGTTEWQSTFGGPGTDDVRGCAFDPWGHVVAAGGYDGAPNLGGTTLPQASNSMFVTKLSPTGAFEWTHGYPGFSGDGGPFGLSARVRSVVSWGDGTVVVSGGLFVGGGIDLGQGKLFGITEPDAFVVGFHP